MAQKKKKSKAPSKRRAAAKKKGVGKGWKSPSARRKVHKMAKRIEKQIGKSVKGDKAAKLRVYHGIAYGKLTGRKPIGGTRGLARKKGKKKKR